MLLAHASGYHDTAETTEGRQQSGSQTQSQSINNTENQNAVNPLQTAGIFFVIVIIIYVLATKFFPE